MGVGIAFAHAASSATHGVVEQHRRPVRREDHGHPPVRRWSLGLELGRHGRPLGRRAGRAQERQSRQRAKGFSSIHVLQMPDRCWCNEILPGAVAGPGRSGGGCWGSPSLEAPMAYDLLAMRSAAVEWWLRDEDPGRSAMVSGSAGVGWLRARRRQRWRHGRVPAGVVPRAGMAGRFSPTRREPACPTPGSRPAGPGRAARAARVGSSERGGSTATGGMTGAGGLPGSGGMLDAGGIVSKGGAIGTGGATGSGGIQGLDGGVVVKLDAAPVPDAPSGTGGLFGVGGAGGARPDVGAGGDLPGETAARDAAMLAMPPQPFALRRPPTATTSSTFATSGQVRGPIPVSPSPRSCRPRSSSRSAAAA